jgi:hypothetical protein
MGVRVSAGGSLGRMVAIGGGAGSDAQATDAGPVGQACPRRLSDLHGVNRFPHLHIVNISGAQDDL